MKIDHYKYKGTVAAHTNGYLMPTVLDLLDDLAARKEIFELGCGNGANAEELQTRGYAVIGVDPSADGIAIAKQRGANLQLHQGSTDEDLAAKYGTFPIVISLEVVEHVYSPAQYAARVYDLLEPGGIAIISTPYHSYAKNLALAVTGKMDNHFTALWEGGHIKFFSRETLSALFAKQQMKEIDFRRVGRVPMLAKSMIAVFQKPAS